MIVPALAGMAWITDFGERHLREMRRLGFINFCRIMWNWQKQACGNGPQVLAILPRLS
jgi:hypothetical protein